MGWGGMAVEIQVHTSKTIPTIKAGGKVFTWTPSASGLAGLHTVTVLLDSRSYTGGNAGKSRDF